MDSNRIFDEVVSFLRGEIGEYSMSITEETIIEDDLGITGDDAIQLIRDFSREFNVDVSDFTFSKYFYPEPGIFTTYKAVQPLTISDLMKGIEIGKLDDSMIF